MKNRSHFSPIFLTLSPIFLPFFHLGGAWCPRTPFHATWGSGLGLSLYYGGPEASNYYIPSAVFCTMAQPSWCPPPARPQLDCDAKCSVFLSGDSPWAPWWCTLEGDTRHDCECPWGCVCSVLWALVAGLWATSRVAGKGGGGGLEGLSLQSALHFLDITSVTIASKLLLANLVNICAGNVERLEVHWDRVNTWCGTNSIGTGGPQDWEFEIFS